MIFGLLFVSYSTYTASSKGLKPKKEKELWTIINQTVYGNGKWDDNLVIKTEQAFDEYLNKSKSPRVLTAKKEFERMKKEWEENKANIAAKQAAIKRKRQAEEFAQKELAQKEAAEKKKANAEKNAKSFADEAAIYFAQAKLRANSLDIKKANEAIKAIEANAIKAEAAAKIAQSEKAQQFATKARSLVKQAKDYLEKKLKKEISNYITQIEATQEKAMQASEKAYKAKEKKGVKNTPEQEQTVKAYKDVISLVTSVQNNVAKARLFSEKALKSSNLEYIQTLKTQIAKMATTISTLEEQIEKSLKAAQKLEEATREAMSVKDASDEEKKERRKKAEAAAREAEKKAEDAALEAEKEAEAAAREAEKESKRLSDEETDAMQSAAV